MRFGCSTHPSDSFPYPPALILPTVSTSSNPSRHLQYRLHTTSSHPRQPWTCAKWNVVQEIEPCGEVSCSIASLTSGWVCQACGRANCRYRWEVWVGNGLKDDAMANGRNVRAVSAPMHRWIRTMSSPPTVPTCPCLESPHRTTSPSLFGRLAMPSL